MSSKDYVKKKYPKSFAHSWRDCWVIYSGTFVNEDLGTGKTASLAWKDAKKQIIKMGKQKIDNGYTLPEGMR